MDPVEFLVMHRRLLFEVETQLQVPLDGRTLEVEVDSCSADSKPSFIQRTSCYSALLYFFRNSVLLGVLCSVICGASAFGSLFPESWVLATTLTM